MCIADLLHQEVQSFFQQFLLILDNLTSDVQSQINIETVKEDELKIEQMSHNMVDLVWKIK